MLTTTKTSQIQCVKLYLQKAYFKCDIFTKDHLFLNKT